MELQQIILNDATMPCLPTTSVPLHFLCTSISHDAMTRCLPTTTRVLSVSLYLSPRASLGSFFPFLQFLDGQGGVPNPQLLSLFSLHLRYSKSLNRGAGEV